MPYGISKKLGGDSPANDAHVENVVNGLESKGFSKVSAIRIAKSQMHHPARASKKHGPRGRR